MKYLLLVLFIAPIYAAEKEYQAAWLCQAPSQSFMEQKLRESFQIAVGEAELREVVLDPRNYALREEIKGFHRRLKFSNRIERSAIETEIPPRFEQMIEITRRRDPIVNFPLDGATSIVSTSNETSIMISMTDLKKEDLDFMPPETLKKLGNEIKILYHYPIDRFEFLLTYDGEELPMAKALSKIQNEFEVACDARGEENFDARQAKIKDRSKKLDFQNSDYRSQGKASRQ